MVEVIEKLLTVLEDSILGRRGHVLEDAIGSVKHPDHPFDHCLKVCYCISFTLIKTKRLNQFGVTHMLIVNVHLYQMCIY